MPKKKAKKTAPVRKTKKGGSKKKYIAKK